MFDFISDLNDYFCEKYAAYDKICVLPGYKMPKMHDVRVAENGRKFAYTLPPETMNIAKQEKKAEILAAFKERAVDDTFSFSFFPLNIFGQLEQFFAKRGFAKNLKTLLEKYNLSEEDAFAGLDVSEEVKNGILGGKFLPTKNLVLSLALTAQLSYEDTVFLLSLFYEEFNFAYAKDVVISYLLQKKIYNPEMVAAALAEFKVANLFIKKSE